jgi:hypothetical protein
MSLQYLNDLRQCLNDLRQEKNPKIVTMANFKDSDMCLGNPNTTEEA